LAEGSLEELVAEIALEIQNLRAENHLREALDTIDLCLTALAIKRQEEN